MSKKYLRINDELKYEAKGSTPKYVEQSSTIVLNQKCVRNGIVDYTFSQFISEKQNIATEKYLKIGDVILNSTGQGTAGRCAFVDYLPTNCKVTVDSHMLILRFKNIELARYFAYSLFNQEDFILELLTGSSGQGELDREIVYNISFPYTERNLGIFNKILIAINDKIQLNNKINSELEKLAKTLYDYWFVQFDFPDENNRPYKSSGGKMVYDERLKREIPETCELKYVKDFLNVTTGKEDANFSKENGAYAFFTCGDEILRCDQPAFSGKSILIAGNGNFNIKYFEGEFNAYQRTYVLTPQNEQYVGVLYLSALNRISAFTRGSNGSIVKFITKGDVENIPVIIPNNKSILYIFNRILDKQNHIKYETEELKNLRDFLLPMLMNGQISIIAE